MLEEVVEDVGDDLLLRGEVIEAHHDADRQRVDVGVEEAAAAHALGAVADHGERRALVAGQVEPSLDRLPGQGYHRLNADGEVVQRLLPAEPRLLGDEGVHAVGGDDHDGPQLVVTGLNADDALATGSVLGEHPVHADAGHDQGAGLLALGGQPWVQLGPQHGDRVDRLGQPGVLVIDGDRAVGVEEVDVIAGDPPLDRRLGEEIREDLLDAAEYRTPPDRS